MYIYYYAENATDSAIIFRKERFNFILLKGSMEGPIERFQGAYKKRNKIESMYSYNVTCNTFIIMNTAEVKFLSKYNCIRNHPSDEEDECPYSHHDKDAKDMLSFWDYILLAKETSKHTYHVDGKRFGPNLSQIH
jgi:hypothetical protein